MVHNLLNMTAAKNYVPYVYDGLWLPSVKLANAKTLQVSDARKSTNVERPPRHSQRLLEAYQKILQRIDYLYGIRMAHADI